MKPVALLLLGAVPTLVGCVPMMAASAVSAVAQSAQGQPVSNEAYQGTARDQCTAKATPYGTVSIIDVEQHSVNKIIVWGTVGEGAAKRSFECDFTTQITGFKLRPITPVG
jgi:hypothetical protein